MPRTLDELQTDVVDFFRQSNSNNLNLFEIACLGKPELALQGELLHHLRNKGWRCVQEAGFRAPVPGTDKLATCNLDILVFDRTQIDFTPVCCIELKHYSANQGDPKALIAALELDYGRPRPRHNTKPVPIMLVAMYTTVAKFSALPPPPGLHRFARAVCGPVRSCTFQSTFSNWYSPWWICGPTALSKSTGIPSHSCVLQTGEQLTGWVEACVGIRT